MAYPYGNDYEAAAMAKAYKKPILKTDRKMWKLALFTILTFGSFILVGEFVYFHKLCTAMNLLCEDYNAKANA